MFVGAPTTHTGLAPPPGVLGGYGAAALEMGSTWDLVMDAEMAFADLGDVPVLGADTDADALGLFDNGLGVHGGAMEPLVSA